VFALTSTEIKTATILFSKIITPTTKDFLNNSTKIQAPITSHTFGEVLGLTKTEPQGYMRYDYSYVRCVQNIK
jgi:hypothetical protein